MNMKFIDRTNEFDSADIEQSKVVSALSYFGILFFLPLIAAPNSKFGKYHANQALVFFLAVAALNIVLQILSTILLFIPILGWIISALLRGVVNLGVFILFIYQLVNTFGGKAMEIPVINTIKIIK
jgi:Predicted membrane protein